MPFASRSRLDWKLRTRSLALGQRTVVMGVLNTTPDSFSDGGAWATKSGAIEQALAMFEEGADIVDVGGESTRPGKREPVGVQQEIDRVIPILEGILRHRPQSILSVDTYKSATAAAAIGAGAEIINDVSGFLWDDSMGQVCAKAGCGVVLMHTRGRPAEWHILPPLQPNQVLPLVRGELQQRLQQALQDGVEADRIVLDPGFGFGKAHGPSHTQNSYTQNSYTRNNYDQNYVLLGGLEALGALGRPLLAGVSRKGFLGRGLSPLYGGQEAPVERRGNASLAAATAAILAGAHLVRVHEVRATCEAALIADAILAAEPTV